MAKKEKFQAPEGLSMKYFQNLTGKIERNNRSNKINSKRRVRKNIIKQIYNSFISNSAFKDLKEEQKKQALTKLKEIIKNAIDNETADDKNNFVKHCRRLLGIKDKLIRTIDHVQEKLDESSGKNSSGELEYYDKFRVKGGKQFLEKFIKDFCDSGSIVYSLGNMDIDDLSEEEVGYLEDELNNFLNEVESNIEKIINYTPLLKVKNDIQKILSSIIVKDKENEKQYNGIQEQSNVNDAEMVKTKRGITKDIFNPWKEEYSKVCDTLLTLETERTFTRFVRKAVQKVTWFGNRLYLFLKAINPF